MKRFLAFLLLPLALVACSKGAESDNGTAATAVAAVPAPAGQSWTDTVAQTDEGYRIGNPNATIKLVEYGDRLCPACKALANAGYDPLLKNYVASGKVNLEFRDFLIHGAPALALAAVGRCGGPAAFFPLLEQNYTDQDAFNQKVIGVTGAQQQALAGKPPGQIATFWAEQMGAIDWAKQRGIPEAKARACLTDEAMLNKLAAVTEKAGTDGTVTGTPTLILNGRKLDAITWPDLEAALKRAGA